jgi:hypothetical protein
MVLKLMRGTAQRRQWLYAGRVKSPSRRMQQRESGNNASLRAYVARCAGAMEKIMIPRSYLIDSSSFLYLNFKGR